MIVSWSTDGRYAINRPVKAVELAAKLIQGCMVSSGSKYDEKKRPKSTCHSAVDLQSAYLPGQYNLFYPIQLEAS